MKITVGQFNVKSKDLEYNFQKIKGLVTKAVDSNFDLIVFGEYSLSGYGCGDLFKSKDFINEIVDYQKKIKALAKDIAIIYGGVKVKNDKLYNAAIFSNKEEEIFSSKENLNKEEFNEKRYFQSGKNKTVKIKEKEFLITFKDDYIEKKIYSKILKIVLDSSNVNDYMEVEEDIVYANTVGVSAVSKVVYINGGNSYINDDSGLYSLKKPLESGLLLAKNPVNKISKLEAIVKGVKVYSDETFGENKKWIVGSSGGLDSAVTVALLTIALGSENVITYNMASKYNKEMTINNAKSIAKKLKVKHVEESIQPLINATYNNLEKFGYDSISTFDQENIQARSRGYLLSAFSALENAVICNNGNKLEIALGYATLYGDTIGALALIGNLSKKEVFELAKEINDYFQDEIIPQNLLPKVKDYRIEWVMPPSAELKEDQLDPMKWFYHDLLLEMILSKSKEEILSLYLKDQFQDLEIGKWLDYYSLKKGENFLNDFNWFYKMLEIAHFKRLQSPPVLAYGKNILEKDVIFSNMPKFKSKRVKDLEKAIVEKYE